MTVSFSAKSPWQSKPGIFRTKKARQRSKLTGLHTMKLRNIPAMWCIIWLEIHQIRVRCRLLRRDATLKCSTPKCSLLSGAGQIGLQKVKSTKKGAKTQKWVLCSCQRASDLLSAVRHLTKLNHETRLVKAARSEAFSTRWVESKVRNASKSKNLR